MINTTVEPSNQIIQKPIPTTLKLLLASLTLGIGATIMKLIVLEGVADPKQSEIIYNIADILFLFGTMFLTLAVSAYNDEHRGK